MQTVSTIGLDIARSVFQIHRADADGVAVSLKWGNVGISKRVVQGLFIAAARLGAP